MILVNLGEQDYKVTQGDKIEQLIVEKILNTEVIRVQNLDATTRGTKGFGSSDWKVTKQDGAGADLLTKPLLQEMKSSLNESLSPLYSQDTPRPQLMTKQSCKVTGPTDHNSSKNGRIHISEITWKEFRQPYRNGETTGVLKFSQKEKQIYLRKINISTELAIRSKEERKIKTKNGEDCLESLVPKEYHDLLQAFEKGEKTVLPPHRPGIHLEINLEEGKGLPDQKIY